MDSPPSTVRPRVGLHSAMCQWPNEQATGPAFHPSGTGYRNPRCAIDLLLEDRHLLVRTERVLYGDGNKDIGVVHLTIYWNLTGAQTLALPVQARNSHSTVHTIFRGALYNGAHHAKDGGKLILSCSPNVRGAAAAEKLVSYPKGCKLYDKGKNYDHNMVVETAWELPQYSGYWYCYFRSPVAHAENKETYRFGKASDLPQDFQKVGHDA